MVRHKSDAGSKPQIPLKDNFLFKRLCNEIDKLSPDRREKALAHIEEKTMYRPDEAAAILGVPADTIRRWLRNGKIRGTKIDRLWLVPKAEIVRITEGNNQ